MGGEAGAPRQPYELSSLGGDHIELRQIGANTGADHGERRRNRPTTAANRGIAQCCSHRLAPERIAAGQPGPPSKPGRWVLALILPLQDRLRPSDGALFRANVATPLLDGRYTPP